MLILFKRIRSFKNRILQLLALYMPGASSFRVWMHRLRGVKIGKGSFIGTAAILETEYPDRIIIGANVGIGIRSIIIAHTSDQTILNPSATVVIEDEVFVGPGVIILPNVTIGKGSVITAGSVVKISVPPGTLVEGNPARAVAKCGIPLSPKTSYSEFIARLRPIK